MKDNYIVYQHVTPDGMYYFGTTQNVKQRWSENGLRYKETTLYPYIEKYGWDGIQHQVLFKDQTKKNAIWIEDFLIQTGWEDGVCINKHRSGNVSKEDGYHNNICKQYYEQNRDKLLERQKQYYEQNRDKVKQYREDNKDKIMEQRKQYREKNRDKLLEQQKQYREQNRDKLLEYQKQYRRRKKESKQFKEFGYIPLF